MPRICPVTGKKKSVGIKYAIRGIAKKKKGIGLNITGKTKREFRLNMVKKRMWFPEEQRFITIKLSTTGLRTIDKLGLAAVVRKMRSEGAKI